MEKEKNVLCPACGAEMELKLEDFSIGADGGGGLLTLLATTYTVDLYACPKCGKVELYTAGFDPNEKDEDSEGDQKETAGTEERQSGGLFGLGRKKDKRPPWEK